MDYEARWSQLPAPSREQAAIELLVVRKGGGVHETPPRIELDPELGIHGDRWSQGERPQRDCQVTLMNVQVARLVVGEQPLHLPGDNVFLDLDLGEEALPVGTRLRLGTALLEVSAEPHLGCKKFAARVGVEALKWVNAKPHRARRLRGVNCRVLEAGQAALGDAVRVLPA